MSSVGLLLKCRSKARRKNNHLPAYHVMFETAMAYILRVIPIIYRGHTSGGVPGSIVNH